VQKPSEYACHAPLINYKYISEAVDYYKGKGYRYVEAPWFVTEEAINVTRPEKARTFQTFAGHLVASGEQSFIDMRGELCPGRKFQCVTPCFRDEPKHDSLHLRCFVKCELIIPLWKDDNPETFLEVVLKDAQVWLGKYGGIRVVTTELGKDIMWGNIELGSYGHRQFKDFRWVYGTGVAEPRLSQAIEMMKHKLDEELEEAMK
jgi:hypothetical protein